VHAEPNLLWWPVCRLLAVERQASLITAVRVEVEGEQRRVRCQVVIDGSDRGDLLPLAEVPFRLSWEPQEQWGEPSAPSQKRIDTEPFFRQQTMQSPTWVVMGQLQSHRLPKDSSRGIDPEGRPKLAAPFEKACHNFGLERTITYGRLPGGMVMLNWPLHGNDWHWSLERAFCGDPKQEADLYAEMQAHSLRFAEVLREATNGWKATNGWLTLGEAFPLEAGSPAPWLAAMPYWREGRRMVGRTTVIEQDLLPMGEGASVAHLPMDAEGELDSIAVGNYANDHHYPGPDWPLAPKSCRWGGRWTGTPFAIPYGALVSADVHNLLAADKAFSTSHMANGATRLQPLILNVGQAAGVAAALAVQQQRQPSDLRARVIQERLIHDQKAPSAVVPLWQVAWHDPHWVPQQQQAIASSEVAQLSQSSPSIPAPTACELEYAGIISPIARDEYRFTDSSNNSWKIISLEPYVDQQLKTIANRLDVRLRGFKNTAGGWIRITSLSAETQQG